jgi:autotransporter-associated beta strand protein
MSKAKSLRGFAGGAAALFLMCASLQAAVITGRIDVVQNDPDNNATSVTVTKVGGSDQFVIRDGSNRGDYNVDVGPSTFNAPLNGVLITCVSENGRDETASGEAGGTFYAFNCTEITGNSYYIPTFQAGTDNEKNMNVAAAYFPFSYGAYGWLGAQVKNTNADGGVNNNQALNTIFGHPSIHVGAEFVDPTTSNGVSIINLTSLSAGDQTSASSANGILLVSGGKNEANYGMSRPNADGTFTAICHNSSSNGVGGENDPIAFAYVPLGSRYIPNGEKDSILLPMGRIKGNGSTDIGQGNYTLTKLTSGAGTYLLKISGFDGSSGTLITGMESSGVTSGGSTNCDNVISYAYDPIQGGWLIQSRDLPTPTLESPLATEMAFSFVFLPDNADVIDRNLRYDSGNWSRSSGGMWYDASSWSSNAIPSADGVEANFGSNLSYSDTVTLDEGSTRMVGKMTFNNSLASYIIGTQDTTASVMLKNTSGTPTIDVQAGSHTLNTSLKLTADSTITVASGSNLTLGGRVLSPATANLTITGSGQVQLGSSSVFTASSTAGNLTINGSLDLNGFNTSVSGLHGNGVIDNTTGIDGYTLTAGGNNADGNFAGVIRNTVGTLGLTKNGTGTLTLSGTNSYVGATTVNAGTLKLAATGSIANSSTITIGTDAAVPATLDLTDQPGFMVGPTQTLRGLGTVATATGSAVTVSGTVSPGSNSTGNLTVSALNFNNSTANSTLTIRIGGTGAVTSDLLTVSNPGGLSLTGANKTMVNVENLGNWDSQNTSIPLINYSGALGGTGFSGFQLNTSYTRFAGYLSDTGSSIIFNITQNNVPRWVGQAIDNNWDTTTSNWKEKDSDLATTYRETPQRDQVIFDDGADVQQTTVNLNGNVMPLSVLVNNFTKDYTFTGLGYITGNASITKRGSGTLTVDTFNDFTGGMTIEGGTVVLTAGSTRKVGSDVTVKSGCTLAVADTISLGSGLTKHVVNLDGGTLQFLATDGYDFVNPITLTANGGTLDTKEQIVTLNAPITAGLGTTFTKKGSGTLVLGSSQGGFFDQYIAEGTLRNLAFSPQSGSTVVIVAAGATFDDSYGNGEDFGGLAGEGTAIMHEGNSFGLSGETATVFSGKITVGTDGTLNPGGVGNFVRAGTGSIILTSPDSDFGGITTIRSGAIIVGANVQESQNGPLGNATGTNAVILLGDTTGNANAGFYVNTPGVTVGRSINVQSGNTGVSTIGGTNTSGIVTFSGNLLFGSGDKPAKGATLTAAEGGTVVFTGVIQVGGGVGTAFDLAKDGLGKVVLSGVNTYPGITTVNAGVLSISADENLGAAPAALDAAHLVLNGGTLEATASLSTNANRGVKLTGAGGTIDVSDSKVLTVIAPISGDAGLNKIGNGTLVLTSAPTYTGATVINSGILSLELNGASATMNSITGSGTLHVGGTTNLTAHSIAVDTLSIGGATLAVTAVPEPSSIVLLALAGLGALWAIRRR